MPDLESTKTFTTPGKARAELRQWKKEAEAQGLRLVGSVKPATPNPKPKPRAK